MKHFKLLCKAYGIFPAKIVPLSANGDRACSAATPQKQVVLWIYTPFKYIYRPELQSFA